MNSGDDREEATEPLKVEFGATAKVSAVAKYELKTEVSINVPEDVTRAKVHGLFSM